LRIVGFPFAFLNLLSPLICVLQSFNVWVCYFIDVLLVFRTSDKMLHFLQLATRSKLHSQTKANAHIDCILMKQNNRHAVAVVASVVASVVVEVAVAVVVPAVVAEFELHFAGPSSSLFRVQLVQVDVPT
jgi:hypothetical protein